MFQKLIQRRHFFSKAISLGLGASLINRLGVGMSIRDKVSQLPSLEGRNILFVWGGWNGHEPEKFKNYYDSWLRGQGATVQLERSLDIYADRSAMSSFDLLIQIMTMSEITKDQEEGLLNAIRDEGMGMAGWHGGMCDAFRQNTEYQFMTGGQWVAHPGGIIEYTVNLTDTSDEVTSGLSDFKMSSEQYYMHVDPNVKVLATTTFGSQHANWINNTVIPVAWKKAYGKGRVFFSSLGHNLAHITGVPEADEMMKRGIKWASASKYLAPENWIEAVYGAK